MNRRPLGRTGLQVSEVGFGAWGIGARQWIGASDDESLRALHRAIDLGLDLIDTALAYGNGHSEQLVGDVARERDEPIVVATKIPPKNRKWPARRDVPVEEVFPADHVTACTEESLRAVLSEWVTNGDIRGIIQRRDEMQKLVDKLVAERGEAYVFMRDRNP